MDDAQVWVLIGGFLAILTAMTSLLLATVRAELRETRTDLGSRIDAVETGLEARLGARIDVLGHKVDGLDRDVRLLFGRVFGSEA